MVLVIRGGGYKNNEVGEKDYITLIMIMFLQHLIHRFSILSIF